jgi:alpha-1,2-mannosyltransferase
VLWAAIRATQDRWPEATCVVYTGDHDAKKDAIITRVQVRLPAVWCFADSVGSVQHHARSAIPALRLPLYARLCSGDNVASLHAAWPVDRLADRRH